MIDALIGFGFGLILGAGGLSCWALCVNSKQIDQHYIGVKDALGREIKLSDKLSFRGKTCIIEWDNDLLSYHLIPQDGIGNTVSIPFTRFTAKECVINE